MFEKCESNLYNEVVEMLKNFSKNFDSNENKDYFHWYEKKTVDGKVVSENEEEYVDGKLVKSAGSETPINEKNSVCTCNCGCKDNYNFKSDIKKYYKSLPTNELIEKIRPSELQVCKLEIAKLKLDIEDYEKEISDLKEENDKMRRERDELRKTLSKISDLLMVEESEEEK